MRIFSILGMRLRSVFGRARADEDLEEELRYHLQRQIDDALAAGLSADEARSAALRSIGDLQQRKEECRDTRGTRWLEDFFGDLRYAARPFRSQKGFFAVAALTLALGIGANTAIFSAVDAVLLRPLPYPQAERLTSVWCNVPSKDIPRMGCALPDLSEFSAHNHSFDAFAEYYYGDVNITDGTPERATAVYASSDLLPLLGATPEPGRPFSRSEQTRGNHVVIITDALWHARFGAAPGAVGASLHLNGQPYTVIGVLPPAFQFENPDAKLWLPMWFAPNDDMATRDNHFISAIARRRAGVTVAAARADIQSIAARIAHQFPQNIGIGADVSGYLESLTGDVRPALLILLTAVGVVLLIACVNVANLLLARASGRLRELSVRAALGAARGRLLRQLLAEGVLLGVIGAGLGLAMSLWLVRLLRVFGPQDIPRVQTIGMNLSVLLFTAAITVVSVVLFALAPAIDMARVQVSEALKEGGRSLAGGLRTSRTRDALVVAEIALSLLLVISAGLLLRSLRRLQQVDPGFSTAGVLSMSITLPYSEPARSARFFDELIRRLDGLSGVEAAGAGTELPITGWGGWGKYFTIDERPAARLADVPLIQYRQITPGYAKALRTRMVGGRFFTEQDTGDRPLVAILNEAARRRFFPGEDPIGKLVVPAPPEALIPDLPSPGFRIPRLTIVGVIADMRESGLSQPVEPELFVPHLQGTAKNNETPANKMFVFIRTASDPLALVSSVRNVVRSLDPQQPIADIATMEDRLRASLAMQRFQLQLFGAFAIASLFLASVGAYGVLSYLVRLRMHEIGVRMALGARAADVLGLLLRHGLTLGIVGVLIGAAAGLGLTRWMASLLYGVQPTDALTFIGSSLALLLVITLATGIPAARAARTDALKVLRTE